MQSALRPRAFFVLIAGFGGPSLVTRARKLLFSRQAHRAFTHSLTTRAGTFFIDDSCGQLQSNTCGVRMIRLGCDRGWLGAAIVNSNLPASILRQFDEQCL